MEVCLRMKTLKDYLLSPLVNHLQNRKVSHVHVPSLKLEMTLLAKQKIEKTWNPDACSKRLTLSKDKLTVEHTDKDAKLGVMK